MANYDDSDDSDIEYDRLVIPTVVDFLKDILRQYPDNGQIIKELVQNAEDAEASEVEILYHQSLSHCGQANERFQHFLKGPAVCLYNNSEFTSDDWKGIKQISESVKKLDALKIGRFGLGFKSVFHMTDYITVLSGSKVMFINPKLDVQHMCCSCNVKKLSHYFPIDYCVTLFAPHLTAQHLEDGHFPGTIFWFPLRQTASVISTTLYTDDKINSLFASFATEAPTMLTFLKSLERISVEILQNNTRKTVCNVAIGEDTISEARVARKHFINKLKARFNTSDQEEIICKYRMTLHIHKDGQLSSEQLLVLHYLQDCDDLSAVQVPGHMPLVGTAVPLSNEKAFVGRMFCFLPLPLDEMNASELQVHINGYFILDQNRRHIRWKTAESIDEADVKWNELLLERNVTEAFFLIVTELQEQIVKGESHPSLWYSVLPYIGRLQGRWLTMAECVWRKLFKSPLIFSEISALFLTVDSVILTNSLDEFTDEICKTVLELLNDIKIPIANVPIEMLKTLHHLGQPIKSVTPQMIRAILKNPYDVPLKWNRMCLLQYVLSDDNFDDLLDVPLLPLESGSWIRFRSRQSSSEEVYICQRSEVDALPFNEDKIVAVDLVEKIKDCLKRICEQAMYQVNLFQRDSHAALLLTNTVEKIRMKNWSQSQTESWLTSVWQLLESVPLSNVLHLPLLPAQENFALTSLVTLSQPTILQTAENRLPNMLIEALHLLGITVILQLPKYVTKHHDLFKYLNRSSGEGIIRSLEKSIASNSTRSLSETFNQKASATACKALLNFFVNHANIRSLSKTIKDLLCKLNLFSVIYGSATGNLICVCACPHMVPPRMSFPIRLPFVMIQESSDTETEVASSLGAKLYSDEELCLLLLDQNMSKPSTMEGLFDYILSNSHLRDSHALKTRLVNVPFVRTRTGEYKKASDLFDPEDKCSVILDALNERIPDARYSTHLDFFRLLGLRNISSITADELIRVAKFLDGLSEVTSYNIGLSIAFMTVLNATPHCIAVCQAVKQLRCITCSISPPEIYPANLAWFANEVLFSPCSVKSHSCFMYTLGSVLPLVNCEGFSNLSQNFGWETRPLVLSFVQHFENVMAAYDVSDPFYQIVVSRVYEQLTAVIKEGHGNKLQSLKQLACILTDQGFQKPENVYIQCSLDDICVAPFGAAPVLFIQQNHGLFRYLGCWDEQSSDFLLNVLKKISEHQTDDANETEKCLQLSINILKKIAKNLDECDSSRLIIPVESESSSLSFAPIGQCTFSSEASEWLAGCEEELGVQIVHHEISQQLATALCVPSLNDHLFAEEEPIMAWEQHELLTTRLRNLLDGYRDGVAIFKELVQNADDARAKKVRFLYDKRKNENAMTKLFSPKMRECQGPALWAYNDATFSDADLDNITEVGGASKMKDQTKIGKFGLGFCSVYNVTDAPSFISGSVYVLFDPHKKYLDEHHKTAGVKFNLSNKRNIFMMQKLIGQFLPFDKIFSCNIQPFKPYPATLFRLPLRTALQASESKISDICYGPSQVNDLLSLFMKMAGNLLIFSQNVEDIEIFHLNEDSDPTDAKLIFQVRRSLRDNLGNILFHNKLLSSTPVSNLAANSQGKLSASSLTSIEITLPNEKTDTLWLISWCCSEQKYEVKSSHGDGKFMPLGGVATPLQKIGNTYHPIELHDLPRGFYKEGHFHCFLPLPVKTSFPVHVNGFYDVAQDRNTLKMPNEDERCAPSDCWNSRLMKGVICNAYLQLLEMISTIGTSGEYPYYQLWPVIRSPLTTLEFALKNSFYDYIMKNFETCKIFRDTSNTVWLPLSACAFMDNRLLAVKDIGDIALKFLEASGHSVVILPDPYATEFRRYTGFTERVITERVFFEVYFLPEISDGNIADDDRDVLIARALDMHSQIKSKLQSTCCIPTQPFGHLKFPKDVIDPKGYSNHLFLPEDEVFPVELLCTYQRLSALRELGMLEDLSDDLLIDRAHSVLRLSCATCAAERSDRILEYLSQRGTVVPCELKDIAFLPVMPKPETWPISWAGDEVPVKHFKPCSQLLHIIASVTRFAAPVKMCINDFSDLLGSTLCVFSKNAFPRHSVLASLAMIVESERIPVAGVIAQLEELSTVLPLMCPLINDFCHKIYKHLNRCAADALRPLREKKILFTGYGFKEPKLFAASIQAQCPPLLFSTEIEGYRGYPDLLKSLGIEIHFKPEFVLDVLNTTGDALKSQQLTRAGIEQLSQLLKLLFYEIESVKKNPDEYDVKELLLPDKGGYLYPANELCIEDNVTSDISMKFKTLHPEIPISSKWAKCLGILTKTKKNLKQNSKRYRISFGQKEPLTTRLKNILEDYPCDVGIMKELLQNADDARATEVAFIKDFRNLPSKNLFDRKWVPLQGPAICVYNNSCFTGKDLEGIQNLGDSRKAKDPDCIGTYGIGFNAVYHLTDAPSFLTRGHQVPYGEVLCMFDPHCRYDPDATVDSPGVEFYNLDELRKLHPDSFLGYLEDSVMKDGGTLFRLPLRGEDAESLIAKHNITPDQAKQLIDEFKREMMKCLQFLRHVQKISVMTVSNDGRIGVEYEVCSTRDGDGMRAVKEMSEYFVSHFSLNNFEALFVAEPLQITSHLELNDSRGNHQKWLVVERLGSYQKPPNSVVAAFKNHRLLLRPYGAIAIQIEGNEKPADNAEEAFRSQPLQSYGATQNVGIPSWQSSCTTSCYLPLPISSGLPFSINGHFALNSSRRDLWVGNDGKMEWNDWLLKEIIAPVAGQALLSYRQWKHRDCNAMSVASYNTATAEYYQLLPDSVKAKSNIWKKLVRYIFDFCIEMELPIWDNFIIDASDHSKGVLSWHPLESSEDIFPLHFWQYSTSKDHAGNIFVDKQLELQNVLKRLGMKIGHVSAELLLRRAEINIRYFTPEAVVEFLYSWNSDLPSKCQLHPETPLVETPFHSVKGVRAVLKYVSLSKSLPNGCDGMPLLVTQDDILKCFDKNSPVFLSSFHFLVPQCKNEFVHHAMIECTKNIMTLHKIVDVIRPFTLKDLADRIASVLDSSYRTCDMIRLTNYFECYLIHFWCFVYTSICEVYVVEVNPWIVGKQKLIEHLGDYALYPVHFKDGTYVTKIKNAHKALLVTEKEVSPFHKLRIPFAKILNTELKYTVPPTELNLPTTLADKVGVLSIICEHTDSIVEMLSTQFSTTSVQKFSKKDAEHILEYFGIDIQKTRLSKEQLRLLPFYENINDQLQSIGDSRVFILWDAKIPKEGLVNIGNSTLDIILKKPESSYVCNLCKYILGVSEEIALIIYVELILPNFHLMPQKCHKTHLEYLKNSLVSWPSSNDCYRQQAVDLLTDIPFIPWKDSLYCAKDFYDPENKVFKIFCEKCLPKEWATQEWHSFLELVGLITKVTSDMFEKFATSLNASDAQVQTKSEVLVIHLFSKYQEMEVAPDRFSHLRFIVPKKRPELNVIYRQYIPDTGLTSLREAVRNKYAVVVWSAASLLPRYAEPHGFDSQKLAKFGIQQEPRDTTIIDHLTTVTSIPKLFKDEQRHEVLDEIYTILSERRSLHHQLHSMSIIYIPDHDTFVEASMIVVNLDEDIAPYLYRLPIRFGKFMKFFIDILGANEKLSCDCLASVLCKLKDKSNGEALNPEESRVMKAVMCRLAQNPQSGLATLSQELFLPTTTGKLVESSKLYIADNKQYLKVVTQGGENIPCMTSFAQLGIPKSVREFVDCLPELARPKFISDVVQEDFNWSDEDELMMSELIERISVHLTCSYFINGLVRYVSHFIGKNGLRFDDAQREGLLYSVKSLEIKQMKSKFLEVDMLLNGKCIGKSPCLYFLKHHEGKWLFFLSSTCDEGNAITALCRLLLKILRQLKWKMDSDSCLILHRLVDISKHTFEISTYLDQNHIKDFTDTDHEGLPFNTELGSYVEHQFLSLLDCDFCQFIKNELVAMKKYIEDIEDDTFIIVQVIAKVSEGQNVMYDVYKVCNGDEEFDVEAHKLYKFLRSKQPTSEKKLAKGGRPQDVVVADSSSPDGTAKEQTLESILKEVKAQIKSIWNNETDLAKRRYLLRRLFLKWHPDKNKDERATQIFQYMQAIIYRLEKGMNVSDDDDSDDVYDYGDEKGGTNYRKPQPSDFRDFSQYWKFNGHYSNSNNYKTFYSQSGKSSKIPDKKEGERWACQAHHDLEAAQRATDTLESPCWIIHMCYQAVEKIMKAAIFMEDRETGYSFCHGSNGHCLNNIALSLSHPEVIRQVADICTRVGDYNLVRYPSADGQLPCNRYNAIDSDYVLKKAEGIFELLGI